MAEKKQMADTLLEKDATSEQIQMLRDETKWHHLLQCGRYWVSLCGCRRLQDNSEKAHQDALEAHKAKVWSGRLAALVEIRLQDELSATLEALEQNFIRKIQVWCNQVHCLAANWLSTSVDRLLRNPTTFPHTSHPKRPRAPSASQKQKLNSHLQMTPTSN